MALDLSNLEKPGVQAAGAVPPLAATPDSLEAAFAKLGGKVVRAATPKESVEPDPEAFAEAGGKFVGKIPTTMPPAKD